MANLLRTAFPHLSDNQIKITVTGLFNLDQDIPAFKEHLRDFLVQIREYTGEDDSDLFLEEREGALKKAQDEKRKIQIAVPGILNPHEMPEEMQEMWAPEMEVRGTGKGNNTNRKTFDRFKKKLSIECVLQKNNNYKQIAVIPEELIDKPEIESLKIVEENKKNLSIEWVLLKQKCLVGGFRMI